MLKTINVTFLTIYCSLIFWLSSQTALPTPMLFEHQDKLHHFSAYFIMGILAWRLVTDYITQPKTIFLISLCFCSLYGASDEWHQSFVPGRQADILDWVADSIGASIALLLAPLIKGKL